MATASMQEQTGSRGCFSLSFPVFHALRKVDLALLVNRHDDKAIAALIMLWLLVLV